MYCIFIVVAEQACTKLVKHTPRITQFEADLQELKGKLSFSKRCNNGADSWYTIICEKCDSLNRQSASGNVCGGEMI